MLVVHLMCAGQVGCVLGLLETFAVWLRGMLGWRAREVPFGGRDKTHAYLDIDYSVNTNRVDAAQAAQALPGWRLLVRSE